MPRKSQTVLASFFELNNRITFKTNWNPTLFLASSHYFSYKMHLIKVGDWSWTPSSKFDDFLFRICIVIYIYFRFIGMSTDCHRGSSMLQVASLLLFMCKFRRQTGADGHYGVTGSPHQECVGAYLSGATLDPLPTPRSRRRWYFALFLAFRQESGEKGWYYDTLASQPLVQRVNVLHHNNLNVSAVEVKLLD